MKSNKFLTLHVAIARQRLIISSLNQNEWVKFWHAIREMSMPLAQKSTCIADASAFFFDWKFI
jgi:hypothetical protein